MKLYFSKGACSLAVRILINELGLKSEYEAVNLQTKKTESGKDFFAINPKGYVPALVTADNKILTENMTIHIYLAETNKATQLLPNVGDFKRYQVIEWINFISTEIHKSFSAIFNPNIADSLKNEFFVPNLKKKFAYVEKQLAQKNYLMGSDYSLPDGYLFVMLLWTQLKKIDIQEYEQLNHYFENLKKRESIKKSLQDEGLQ